MGGWGVLYECSEITLEMPKDCADFEGSGQSAGGGEGLCFKCSLHPPSLRSSMSLLSLRGMETKGLGLCGGTEGILRRGHGTGDGMESSPWGARRCFTWGKSELRAA